MKRTIRFPALLSSSSLMEMGWWRTTGLAVLENGSAITYTPMLDNAAGLAKKCEVIKARHPETRDKNVLCAGTQ